MLNTSCSGQGHKCYESKVHSMLAWDETKVPTRSGVYKIIEGYGTVNDNENG